MAHGTPEQKERYIEKMVRGEEVWCQLFSEPAAGSDLAGLRTTAVKDGDAGSSTARRSGPPARTTPTWGMIVTRTDPTRAPSTRASPTSSST